MSTRIPSKYLVEVKTFFSTTQYILLLQERELTRYSIEKDNRQQVVDQYDWNLLLDVQASPRSPTEFTIDILHRHIPHHKDRLQLIQSGNKANQTSQLVLWCAERDKLVAELKHIIHKKNNGGKPIQDFKIWGSRRELTDHENESAAMFTIGGGGAAALSTSSVSQVKLGINANSGQRQLCKAKIYPSAITLLIDRQSDKKRGQDTHLGENIHHHHHMMRHNQMRRAAGGEMFTSTNMPMESIMVSAINNDGLDTSSNMIMEESRSVIGDPFFDDHSAGGRSHVTGNYMQSQAPFNERLITTTPNDLSQGDDFKLRAEKDLEDYDRQMEQQQRGNDFLGFGDDREVDGNQVGDDGAIGMQGHGVPINTAFGANYVRNHNPKRNDRYSLHAIYLNELVLIATKDMTISLVQENQDIEQIVCEDQAQFEEFLRQTCTAYADLMKQEIRVVSLRQDDSLRSQVDFLKWPGCDHYFQTTCACAKSCFKVPVDYVKSQNVTLIDHSIELDHQNIYLVSKSTGKPVKQRPLIALQSLQVIDDSPVCNLKLSFDSHIQINVKAATHHDRERLIASIVTMRNLAMTDQRGILCLDSLKVLHNRPLDHSHQIQAYSPTNAFYENFSQSLTIEYETSLIRKLSEHMQSQVQTMDLNNIIDEILLNATFCYITKVPESCLKFIMDDLRLWFQRYLEYEEYNADLVEIFLNKATLQIKKEAQINFLTMLQADLSSSRRPFSQAKDLNLMHKDDRHTESEKEFQSIFEQTIRYLNILKCLLNSRVFLQEMSNRQEILQSLTLLMVSKSSVIALLAADVLKAACHHFSGKESRIEKVNKKVLIRGSESAQPARPYTIRSPQFVPQIKSTYVQRDKKVYFFDAIFDYLLYFEKLYDEAGVVKSQHFAGINLVLSSILCERKQSTAVEDFAVFALTVSHAARSEKEERESNRPIFQLLDKFCLLDADYFDVQYFSTMMLTMSLDYFFTQEDLNCLKSFQQYSLTYSIQFIWHLYLLMVSKIPHQRVFSIRHLAMLLHSNQESHDLLQRILPRTLFQKVKTKDLKIKSLHWDAPIWEEFFTRVVPYNFDSATEQWNNAMRAELTDKLLIAKDNFIEVKKQNHATITSTERCELFLPIHEFSPGKLVMCRWKNIKWNYKEFEVEYDHLAKEYLVGNYFLARLLQLKPPSQGGTDNNSEVERPQLTMPVMQPAVFWNELLMQFMASKDKKEMKMIVMTMCVVYRQYSAEIGPMQTIPYWLKLIEHAEFTCVHFLLLQLLHVAFSVPGNLAKVNMQMLIKAKGLRVLHNCMNLVFKDLREPPGTVRDNINGDQSCSKEHSSSFAANDNHSDDGFDAQQLPNHLVPQSEQLGQVIGDDSVKDDDSFFDIDFNQINFTDSNQLARYFTCNSLNVNKGILALRIIDQVFKSMQFQFHLPMPTNVEYMLQRHALATLTQMLMLQNIHLTREVLYFIEQHLKNHYALYKLKDSGLLEYLILALNTRNGERALSLLLSVQEVCIAFNRELDFSKFNCHDREMIREDKQYVFGQEQQNWGDHSGILNEMEISLAGVNDPNAPLFDETYAEFKRQGKPLPPLLESIFLRYLPTPFIQFLFEQGKNEFLKVYRMDSYCHPILIWNKDLRQMLEDRIQAKAHSFIAKLANFATDPLRFDKPNEIPVYTDSVQQVINYESIEEEVRCGRYYLSVWTKQAKENRDNFYQIPRQEEEEFHTKLKAELRDCIDVEQFADQAKIITLLKSCLLALKKFSEKRIRCLSEIKTILVRTAKNSGSDQATVLQEGAASDPDKKMILLTGMRIVSMAIHHDQENRQEVLDMDGVRTISDIISHVLNFSKKRPSLKDTTARNASGHVNDDDGGVDEVPVKDISKQSKKRQKLDLNEESSCSIDRVSAKTLNLCIDSITSLVNQDMRAFMEFPLDQRVQIFQQMSQLLDLSFELYPYLEKRKLKPFSLQKQPSAVAADTKIQTESPSVQKQKRLNDMLPQALVEYQNRANAALKNNQSSAAASVNSHDPRMPQTPTQPYSSTAIEFNDSQVPGFATKAHSGKSVLYDYENRSLISIIKESKSQAVDQRPDPYSICLIFNIASAIFRLLKSVAVYPMMHPALISSGLLWRTIQHCYFDLTEKIQKAGLDHRRENILSTILKDCTFSLKLVVTFVDKFMKCKPEEKQRFGPNFTNKTVLKILKGYHECIKKLFTAKILEKLFIEFVITKELKLETTEQNINKDFLKLFSTEQLQSPELVWNEQTRTELHAKLRSQIQSMEENPDLITSSESALTTAFSSEIIDFEYSVNKTELRIQGIFVKYFNEQCRQGLLGNFSKNKLARFANQIIDKLNEFSKEPHVNAKNIQELVEAFKNLMISLNLVITSETDFERYFATLCNFIELRSNTETLKVDQIEEESKGQRGCDETIEKDEKVRIFQLSTHILEIFRALINRRLKVPQLVYPQAMMPAYGSGRQSARLSNRMSFLSSSGPSSGRNSARLSIGSMQGSQAPVMLDEQGKVLSQEKKAEQMCHLEHGNFLLKCKPFFRLLVRMMYQREIQVVPLKEEVIPMLQDMINIPEYVMRLFIDQGLIMFLLNLIFDLKYASVISKEIRGTLTDQVLKIDRVMQSIDRGNLLGFSDRQSYGVVKAFIPPNFFAEINEQMWRWRDHHKQELVQLQMSFLENFDKNNFENALVKWDQGLRDQSMAKVRELCEKILRDEPIQDLRTLHQITNMELEKEERIMEVILRNYNRNPAVFINTKLNGFITEVANQLFVVSQQIYALRQDDVDGMLKAVKIERLCENPEKMTNTQRRYKYLCYQAQLQLTTLLLSIEQLLYNEYNPNLLQTRLDEKLDAQSRLTAQLIQRTTDTRQVEEKVFKYFNLWLQYPVFLDDEMSEHIRITFLQALFLIFDVQSSMAYFKKTEVPLQFISSMINRIYREQKEYISNKQRLISPSRSSADVSQNNGRQSSTHHDTSMYSSRSIKIQDSRNIENSLILLICQRMLRADNQYTSPQLALKETLDQLVAIEKHQRPLQRHIRHILCQIQQNTHYSSNVNDVIREINFDQSNMRYPDQVWRAKPTSASHARSYYEWTDSHTIKQTHYSRQLDKLPILSPEAIRVIRYEFLPDELRNFIETSTTDWQNQRLSADIVHRRKVERQAEEISTTETPFKEKQQNDLADLLEDVVDDKKDKSTPTKDHGIVEETKQTFEDSASSKEPGTPRKVRHERKPSMPLLTKMPQTVTIEEVQSKDYETQSLLEEEQKNDLNQVEEQKGPDSPTNADDNQAISPKLSEKEDGQDEEDQKEVGDTENDDDDD